MQYLNDTRSDGPYPQWLLSEDMMQDFSATLSLAGRPVEPIPPVAKVFFAGIHNRPVGQTGTIRKALGMARKDTESPVKGSNYPAYPHIQTGI